jgi:hypothetical protein
MKRNPRGSEWRKWDLHVHPPGTKLSDNYEPKEGQPDWDRFCKAIHDSDVQAVGIADYFSLDGFFAFKENYDRLYPDSDKVFFPNLELRLNETVNRAVELVDLHVIFPPDLTRNKADEFLQTLKTQLTDDSCRGKSCAELGGPIDFESASVSRDDLRKAIDSTYGSRAVETDHFLLVAAVNNSGIRPDTGNQRKMALSDELDKFANAFFGNPANTAYFLDPYRLETPDQRIPPKPVFACCDAHSFAVLEAWLGTEVTGDNEKHPTWIKADLTFEGLQQTLVEPSERVKIQALAPDKKEPYKVISRIIFTDSDDFPDEVVFNPGLNAIIGSRSSGKSALLAYVAHAVDADYTIRQQVAAGIDEKDAGPGASFTWGAVEYMQYTVEWASPAVSTGQVIYIPQNSLYAISERPDDITARIQPAVFRNAPDFEADFRRTERDVDGRNKSIRNAVSEWFALDAEVRTLNEEIRGLGDQKAITDRQAELVEEIKTMQESSTLTEEEVKSYQQVIGDIAKNKARLQEIDKEERDLSPYVRPDTEGGVFEATDQVSVSIEMSPSPALLQEALQTTLETILDEARVQLLDRLKSSIAAHRATLEFERRELTEANYKLETENKDLIEKNLANTQIAALVKNLKDQEYNLAEIDKKKTLSKAKVEKQDELAASIGTNIGARELLLDSLKEDFNASDNQLEGMSFTIEVAYDSEDIDRVSDGFNKHETSPYVISQKCVNVEKALSEPEKFLRHMGSGKQKLKRGEDVVAVTKAVLTTTKDVRFVASLEGDHIGGFCKSSMTPGKQALFALTLILAESDEPWPLLIDQPEDDLDSRSVCDVIIKDLMRRKRERQVIMVSHNANLVIGADSEEIIVANRHGVDRPNRGDKTFAYLTGSLEHSQPKNSRERLVLESAGIREHACEILDGGAEAFQKRKDKYRI